MAAFKPCMLKSQSIIDCTKLFLSIAELIPELLRFLISFNLVEAGGYISNSYCFLLLLISHTRISQLHMQCQTKDKSE